MIATGVIGGAFMLLIALTSISFGTLVDRFRKLDVMRLATAFALAMFLISGAIYVLAPDSEIARLDRPWFWIYAILILTGAVVENARNIALSTTVTILIDPDKRANANGFVGMVQGMSFIVTSVVAGLSIGLLGMGWTHLIALALTAATLVHLIQISMPEEVKPAATDAQGGFDIKGSWRAVAAVSGLFALIIFSTLNNFIGGVYMALMDPYGLELFSVEMWGIVFAIGGTGFIIGGALIGKFGLGQNPLRTLLLAVMAMGVVGAFEASAAPVTAFLIAPIVGLWIIPWSRSPEGAAALEPWLGTGVSRGIALIFLVAGLVMVLAAVVAFLGPVYRRISEDYAQAARKDAEQAPKDAVM